MSRERFRGKEMVRRGLIEISRGLGRERVIRKMGGSEIRRGEYIYDEPVRPEEC